MRHLNVLLFLYIIFVTTANATINERMSLPDHAGVIETIKKYKLAKVEVKDEYGQLVQVEFENDEGTNEKYILLFQKCTASALGDNRQFHCSDNLSAERLQLIEIVTTFDLSQFILYDVFKDITSSQKTGLASKLPFQAKDNSGTTPKPKSSLAKETSPSSAFASLDSQRAVLADAKQSSSPKQPLTDSPKLTSTNSGALIALIIVVLLGIFIFFILRQTKK
jgi:hypothetical protein